MAQIEASLVTYLNTLSGLTALVGDAISPMRAAQDEGYPRVTYQKISDLKPWTLDGGPGSFVEARFQLDCWGLSAASVKNVADAIIGTEASQKLNGYRGTMGSHFVQMARVDSSQDLYETPEHSDDVGVYRVQMDLTLVYNEA